MGDNEQQDVFQEFLRPDVWQAEPSQSTMRRPVFARNANGEQPEQDEPWSALSEEWHDPQWDYASPSSDEFQGLTPGTERDGNPQEQQQWTQGQWQGAQWHAQLPQHIPQDQWRGQYTPQPQWQPQWQGQQWQGQPMLAYPMGYPQVMYQPVPWQPFVQSPIPQGQPFMSPAPPPAPTPMLQPVKQESRSPPQRVLKPAGQVPTQPKKGFRRSKLPADQRLQVSQMRKLGACWRCVFQKDPCLGTNGEHRCDRCVKARQIERPSIIPLPCDRTKLPYLVFDFLPASMTMVHHKNNIEDTVRVEVVRWKAPVYISLTAGFGPDLTWEVYEFEPASDELLLQYQYFINETTRQMERRDKWSPPLGIKELGREERVFEAYLDQILNNPDYLMEFVEMCYASESQRETFQEDMLRGMCQLYLDTTDDELRTILKLILRMLVLTHIMGHTLTLVDDICARYGRPPQEYTSPKLANRQLKFYFAVLREEIYKELLKYGQNTLRANKDVTWLPMFLVMLGFAMMLEEVQGVLAIQAIGRSSKVDLSWHEAQDQAVRACERIDERYNLLISLFQHKYRSGSWTVGSFGPGCPDVEPSAVRFCQDLRAQLEMKEQHLRRRKDVPLGHEHQCDYITRLVARFLVPFLDLPGA